MRVAGAQIFARLGIELFMIQLYARWGSSAILRYVQDAPLTQQHKVAGQIARTMRSLDDVQKQVTVKIDGTGAKCVQKACEEFLDGKDRVLPKKAQLEALTRRVERVEQIVDAGHKYVMNLKTFRIHKVAVWGDKIPPAEWRTICNWDFALNSFQWIPDIPEEKRQKASGTCDRCWRRTKCDRGELKRGKANPEKGTQDEGDTSSGSEPENDY